MKIGEAAKASSVSTKMIRYYESVGLIAAASRADTGYRIYSEDDVHVLRFLRRARDLGFAVAEMHELLALWRDSGRASADVKRAALSHIAKLEATVAGLGEMIVTLRQLADACDGDERPECPIIDDLASSHASKAGVGHHRFRMCDAAGMPRRRHARPPIGSDGAFD